MACDDQLSSRNAYGKPTARSVLESLLPDAEALHLSSVALKEHLGLAVDRFKGWS